VAGARVMREEAAMRKGLGWFIAVVALGVGVSSGVGHATPAAGFTGTTVALARFQEFSINLHTIPADIWQSQQRTRGDSDLYVQQNVWQPGGSTGWHSHPGHSLIIVTAGTLTNYESDDPTCTPHVYTAGQGFVDEGGDHVHLVRNEGSVEARGYAVQLIPAASARRIDAPAPGNCPF
jgi:quercetin dioxygenase-like cupin family protein